MQHTQPHPDGARLGEVVESTSTGFTTHCYRLDELPPLGGLVRGGETAQVYGIVYAASTRSIDPARHPIPRGADVDTEEAVYRENPQLERLLVSEFHSVIVGYRRGGEVVRHLTQRPPRIHSFVRECASEELREFSRSMDFAPLLLAAPTTAQDEVLAAFLRLARDSHPDPDGFLVRAGRELVAYFPGQTQRLSGVLRRLAW